MKKTVVLFAAIAMLLGFEMHNADAQSISSEANKTVETITTSSSYFENFPPDTAVIVLSIETQAKTASEAAALNSKKANNVIDKIKTLIDKNSGDFIKTSGYSVFPVYDYNNILKKQQLTGYRVSNQLTVTTKQLSNVSKILDSSIENGANNVQGISFTIDDKKDYCNIVTSKAVKKAREQALSVAKALGVTVSGVKNVNVSCGSSYMESAVPFMAKSAMAGAYAVSTPIESGEVRIQGNVNIDFYIENSKT